MARRGTHLSAATKAKISASLKARHRGQSKALHSGSFASANKQYRAAKKAHTNAILHPPSASSTSRHQSAGPNKRATERRKTVRGAQKDYDKAVSNLEGQKLERKKIARERREAYLAEAAKPSGTHSSNATAARSQKVIHLSDLPESSRNNIAAGAFKRKNKARGRSEHAAADRGIAAVGAALRGNRTFDPPARVSLKGNAAPSGSHAAKASPTTGGPKPRQLTDAQKAAKRERARARRARRSS